METKRCSKCKEVKPLKEFNKNRAMQDGFSHYCKICSRIESAKWREKNKEKIEEYKRKRERKRKYTQPKKIVKIEPMKLLKSPPYQPKPIQALDKKEIQRKQYKKNKTYVIESKSDKFTTGHFKGRLILENENFIILENELGIKECFMKVDFMTGEAMIKEVAR